MTMSSGRGSVMFLLAVSALAFDSVELVQTNVAPETAEELVREVVEAAEGNIIKGADPAAMANKAAHAAADAIKQLDALDEKPADDVVEEEISTARDVIAQLMANDAKEDQCPIKKDEMFYSKRCEMYPDKLVVMVSVGNNFMDFFENWYLFAAPQINCSFMQLVAFADDEESHDALQKFKAKGHEIDIVAPSQGSSLLGRWDYGDEGYKQFVARRPDYINNLMQAGCSVLYSDIDIVWQGNVFKELQKFKLSGGGASDMLLYRDNKDEETNNKFCTGFMYFMPTSFTKEVIQDWGKEVGHSFNQGVFNRVLRKNDYEAHAVNVLDSDKFFGPYKDHAPISEGVMIHANWIIGHDEKKQFFKENNLWKLDD